LRHGATVLAQSLLALLALAPLARAEGIVAARLVLPTDRYDHAVLGDALEWGGLRLTLEGGAEVTITLPPERVFEDVEARLADLDGDGRAEVVVVETDLRQGASLAVYDAGGRRAATAFIGQTHRWLAPAGIGDFDGNGEVEIAYVDRPHLLRDVVFVALQGGTLVELARAPGFTNHRIGDSRISGGVLRGCTGGDVLVLADPDWRALSRLQHRDGAVIATPAGPVPKGPDWARGQDC
jgi:hypothetical protein